MDEKIIAENIQQSRKQQKMTLQELADKTGLTKGYLSKIERSEKAPPYSTLNKVAGALGVEITDIFKKDIGTTQNRPIVSCQLEHDILHAHHLMEPADIFPGVPEVHSPPHNSGW